MNLRKKSKRFRGKSLIPCLYIIKAEICSIFQKYKRAVVPLDYKTPTSYRNFCAYFLALYSRLWTPCLQMLLIIVIYMKDAQILW